MSTNFFPCILSLLTQHPSLALACVQISFAFSYACFGMFVYILSSTISRSIVRYCYYCMTFFLLCFYLLNKLTFSFPLASISLGQKVFRLYLTQLYALKCVTWHIFVLV